MLEGGFYFKHYMTKQRSRTIRLIAAAAAALVIAGVKSLPIRSMVADKQSHAFVERVVDGDTLKLANGERIRLIGVDTPELHYSEKLLRDAKRTKRDIQEIQALGKRAADFTRNLCSGKRVRLEYDAEKKDRYRRTLAYVYLEDGTFVNAKILEEGYGQVMTIPPNVKYADHFLKLQREARENRRGLWGDVDSM
jgi:micrococcal nuclease